MIFLSITGSWTAAVIYDRREKRRIQQKWTKLVEHISKETLDEHQMPRKLTVYISAPPADGLVPARDHFNEYVKPILVAAALDWDAIEGRREGDVRAGLAERIRRLRARRGEPILEHRQPDVQDLIDETRQRAGIREWDGHGGDVVIGRHTWKEYVRGLHEGWLGPLDPPAPLVEETQTLAPGAEPAAVEAGGGLSQPSANNTSPTAAPEPFKQEESEKAKEEDKKPKKKIQAPPFNTTEDYEASPLSPNCPLALGPSTVISLPHLLGFLNFPIRMHRFLNRRKVADEIGRQTAAAVLGAYRPFHTSAETTALSDEDSINSSTWEQDRLLVHEESEWHKTARERKGNEQEERVWLDKMVIDARIGERMRKFELEAEIEERAKSTPLGSGVSWFTSLWPEKPEKKPWQGLTDDVD